MQRSDCFLPKLFIQTKGYENSDRQQRKGKTAIAPVNPYNLKYPHSPKPPMTAKEQLLQEIEKSSEPLLQEVLAFLLSVRSEKYPETHKPIWQIAQEIMADVPPEIIAQLPTDGAEQHDHYIYGTPKRDS